MRTVGYWVGRVRGMARHFTAGVENMVREAELEEMEKRWREENERIMRLHPANAHYPEPGQAGRDAAGRRGARSRTSLPFDETQPEDEIPVEKRPLP